MGTGSKLANGVKALPYVALARDTGVGIYENIEANTPAQRVISDAAVDIGVGLGGIALSTKVGALIGTAIPVPMVGSVVGAVVGVGVGIGIYFLTEVVNIKGKSAVGWMKEGAGWVADKVTNGFNSFVSQFSF